MTSYLNNGYDVMKYFAKFEKFIPHSIIMPSFLTIGSQMPELDRGAFLPPPQYKIGCQNTPYILGLKASEMLKVSSNFDICNFVQISRNLGFLQVEKRAMFWEISHLD